jgi:GDP-L-fucose synthase
VTSLDLSSSKILVTGGAGFFGSHVCERLRAMGARDLLVPRSADVDMRYRAQIDAYLDQHRPDVIVHLAAIVGGIGANRAAPGRFLYENAIMGLELMESARRHDVAKVLMAGTICSYPKDTPVPFREDDIWNGYPEETNAPYGLAKKLLLVQADAYRRQYGMNVICLLFVNLYGPRDNFDQETSHVIPALIRKCVEAKEAGLPRIEAWGDGTATREFLHVRDAAEALVLALERYDGGEFMNVGTGREITVRELASAIAREVGYEGQIVWDASRPNGQPRRCLDVTRIRERLGWSARVPFEEGLAETVRWYLDQRASRR